MDDIKKYIDVDYLVSFWNRIKTLPANAQLTVVGSTLSGNTGTLLQQLAELYKKIGEVGIEAEKHTTVATGTANGITVTQTSKAGEPLAYTIELSEAELDKIAQLIADESLYVTKTGIEAVDVSTWGSSGHITVDGKTFTVTLPANPAANLVGGDSEMVNGIQVSIDKDTLAPTLTVNPGEVTSTTTTVVTGGEVYDAIEAAKAQQEHINVANETITGGSLISGEITVQSSATGDGTVDLTLTPELTTVEGKTNTAIATKEYVDEAVAGKNTSYSFKETTVALTAGTGSAAKKYSGVLTLQKTDNDAKSTEDVDTVTIEIDGTEFLKDSYLESASIEGTVLTMVMNTSGGATTPVTVDLATFLDTYTGGNGIIVNSSTKAISVDNGAYIAVDANGVTLDTSKLQGYTTTPTVASDNNIATKGYVDEQIANAQVSATVSGSPVEAFGGSGSITIKTSKDDTTGKTLSVTLPTFTTGASTSTNVSVAIDNDGKITTTTKEVGATDTTKYTNTKLAQAGYVDEKVADAALTAGNGIDITSNVVSAKTTGYVTKGTTGLNIDSDKITDAATASTGENANLVTKGYVDKMVADDKVSITTSENNLTITTPTSGTAGKDFDINVPTATFDPTLFAY